MAPRAQKHIQVVYAISESSSDGSTAPPSRKRGRPAKPVDWTPDPSEYENLSQKDKRYVTLRLRNNEASRRSRLNRKIKQEEFENEAAELEKRNVWLTVMENSLRREVERWKKGVIELVMLP